MPQVVSQSRQPDTVEETVTLSRADLQREHDMLLARVQHLRRILKLAPLPTGKQRRQERYAG